MLLREDGDGVLTIGQASHAWISGQLARAWGNAAFGTLEPREEICLAAEQHDIGMAAWDLTPTLNPQTGLPHSFLEMPIATHMELWQAAPGRLLRQSRYAALLVSMHGARLYERRNLDRLAPEDAAAVRAFIAEQRGFQDELVQTLRDDPATAGAAAPGTIKRNSDLIWTWDFLSLALCLDWAPRELGGVPTAGEATTLSLEPTEDQAITIAPWPFREDRLSVRCEGKRLRGRFETAQALSAGLAAARWETVRFELRRA
jgi:hypothetical protein